MKKIKSVICGAVAAVLAAATAAFGGNPYSAKAEPAENQKFALNTGAYTLKMDDSVTETVVYKHTESYLFNKRDTEGNIRLKFRTVSSSYKLKSAEFYGLVRGKGSDTAYAYADEKLGIIYWYVYGNGESGKGDVNIYEKDKVTDILYDVAAHAFTVTVDGADQSSLMSKFSGSKDAATIDATKPTKICWDALNDNGSINAELADFAVTDADGYDLGLELSPNADKYPDKLLRTEYYGYEGKTVTVKNFDDPDAVPILMDENGLALNVELTKNADGGYSFVMPSCAVTVIDYFQLTDKSYYGTYYDAASGQGFVFGDTSYKFSSGAKTDVSVKAYNVGAVIVTENGKDTTFTLRYGRLMLGETVYNKLIKYTVNFVVDGKSVKTVTVDGGEYTIDNPDGLAPAKEGYTFVGWKTGKGETFDFGSTVSESLTLYADYRSNEEHKNPKEEKGGCRSDMGAGLAILPAIVVMAFAVKNGRKGKV